MTGKRYKTNSEKVAVDKKYAAREAFETLKGFAAPKFDETIDLCVRLGVDPKQADQMVRASVKLPHGTGKEVRVVVIAKADKAQQAKSAGADIVGDQDVLDKIAKGWFDFDKLIATPDMMAAVGKLGSSLGPRGLMPNPKTGTVTFEVEKAVKDIKAGKVDFRVDKTGNVHTVVGRMSFDAEKLAQNLSAVMDSIVKAKPSSAKGVYIKNISVSGTMSPSVTLDPGQFQ